MHRITRLALSAVVVMAVATTGCSSGKSKTAAPTSAGDQAQTTGGDPQSVAALTSAAAAMRSAASYRFVATVTDGAAKTVLTGEFQAPDRVHQTVDIGGRIVSEIVFIGPQAFVKDLATGQWHNRVQTTTPSGPASDVRATFSALAKVTRAEKAGDLLRFTVPAAAAAELAQGLGASGPLAVTGDAKVGGGRLLSLHYTVSGGGRVIDVQIAYRDIGSAPPVNQPAITP